MDSSERLTRIRDIDATLSPDGQKRLGTERAILIWQEVLDHGPKGREAIAATLGKTIGAIDQAIAKAKAATTEVFVGLPGRAISTYDLLDEMEDKYDLDRREAHESILSFLEDIIGIEGDDVIVTRQPVNPELLTYNPHDLDITWWRTIRETTADEIREAFAAVYGDE